MSIYKGISFFRYGYDKSIILEDIDIVKIDLYNHIFTRRGSRVKMPRFGTFIPDALFEPFDDQTIEKIYRDIVYVIEYDPRVELIGDVNVYPLYDQSTLYVTATLRYIELDVTDRFDLNLEFKG